MSNLNIKSKDFVWTFTAFGAVALSGLAINQVIANQLGVIALGRYNMLLAIVIIGGQIGAMGIHSSVLYHTPKARSEEGNTSEILNAGLWATTFTSLTTTLLIYSGGEIVLRWSDNSYYLDGLRAVAVGLFLYPINKSLLAHINGLQRIRAFSIFFSGRFVLLAGLATIASYWSSNDRILPWTISGAEIAIFLGLMLTNKSELSGLSQWRKSKKMVTEHLRYGRRGFLGSTLLDLNTRLDIILLGLISGTRSVGVYSIASLFAEGLYQAAMVPRYILDPVVTSLFVQNKISELQETIARAKRQIYLLAIPLLVISNLLYPIVVEFLFTKEIADESWPVFLILSLGVGLSSGYIPFTNILQQSGFPARQSLLLVGMTLTNLFLNMLLIPFLDTKGAALATAASWLSIVFFLRQITKRTLGFKV